MTADDSELYCGWRAAMNGEPDDPLASEKWREGYRIGLAQLMKKRAA